jgi:glycerol uptake facilitator-like aquaporin
MSDEPDRVPAADLTHTSVSNVTVFSAEVVGTCVLMIVGPGSAILAARPSASSVSPLHSGSPC